MLKTVHSSMISLWIGHLVMDFMLGVWPVYKTLAHLDIQSAGLAAGAGMFLGEGLMLLFGYLCDRGFLKKLLIIGLLLMGSVALYSSVQSYFFLFLLIFCTYMGSSAFHPAAVGVIGHWFQERSGYFLALFFSAGTIGAAISQTLFANAYNFFGGGTWILSLPVLLAVFLIVWVRIPKEKEACGPTDWRDLYRELSRHRQQLAVLFAIQALIQCVLLSLIFLLPEVLGAMRQPEWFQYGGGNIFFVMGAALLSMPIGYYMQRCGIQVLLLGTTALSMILLYLFLLSGGQSLIETSALLFVLGGAIGVSQPLVIEAARIMFPKKVSSFVGGLMLGLSACIASIGVTAAGLIVGAPNDNGPIEALEIIGCLYAVILPLCIFLKAYSK